MGQTDGRTDGMQLFITPIVDTRVLWPLGGAARMCTCCSFIALCEHSGVQFYLFFIY